MHIKMPKSIAHNSLLSLSITQCIRKIKYQDNDDTAAMWYL